MMLRKKPISKYKRRSLYKATTIPAQLMDKGIRPVKFVASWMIFPLFASSPSVSVAGTHTLPWILS